MIIAANDVGCHWPRALDHWCTLHPDKMPRWQKERRAQGLSADYVTWGRRAHILDVQIRPWHGGSSGMLAVQVAATLGCSKAVLCGVPMTATPHFEESVEHRTGHAWNSVAGHWRAWGQHLSKMQGWVRSMSGRTRELLGAPTVAWLAAPPGEADG